LAQEITEETGIRSTEIGVPSAPSYVPAREKEEGSDKAEEFVRENLPTGRPVSRFSIEAEAAQ